MAGYIFCMIWSVVPADQIMRSLFFGTVKGELL